jgi:hypothetical protein
VPLLDLTTLIVLMFAVARVTRLIVDDKISLPLRQWVLRKSGEDGWFFYLVTCPWCMGVWVAAAMTTTTYLWQSKIWATMLSLLAVAQVASTILTMTPTITVKKDE